MPVIALAGVSCACFWCFDTHRSLSDSPGIGQLAWRAALGRDLPCWSAFTLLLTAITVVANLLADLGDGALWDAPPHENLRIIAAVILTLWVVLSMGPISFRHTTMPCSFANMPTNHPPGLSLLHRRPGRDRLSRLLHGSRVSLLCAPAAALVSVGIATLIGLFSGHYGGWVDKLLRGYDLFLCCPGYLPFSLCGSAAVARFSLGPLRLLSSCCSRRLGICCSRGFAPPSRVCADPG